MDIVSLKEVVDLRAVKYLNSMPKAWWKEILNTDKDRKFEVEYKKVKSFLSGQLDGTGITRQYKYADGKTFGRQFDHSGLQGMQKAIRGALCEGSVSDLDMVNCHPMILAWICRKYDIACPNLEYYIKNRDKIQTEICENVPSISIGANPTFTVDTINLTVAEILADEVNAPITCQALLESANTAVITSNTLASGYHLLPPRGKLIHAHLIPFTNFYQTANNADNTVNNTPAGSHTQLTDTGLARDAADWRQYDKWKTQGSVFTNTDTRMFESVSNYGVKCKVAGYYKITCHMCFHSTAQNSPVAVRFAQGALNNFVNDADFENPGPVQVSGPMINIGATRNTSSTTSLSHVINCAANDVLSVCTTRAGTTGTVTTAACTCTLRVEYKGPSS